MSTSWASCQKGRNKTQCQYSPGPQARTFCGRVEAFLQAASILSTVVAMEELEERECGEVHGLGLVPLSISINVRHY